MFGRDVEDGEDEDCGGTEFDGAAEVSAIRSRTATDTELSRLGVLRRL
jgi:hypothetical protein